MTSFNASSTTDDVLEGVDLSGKRILVTGVSAGLGVETARTLVAHGATVIGTARDLAKGERATAAIAGPGLLRIVECDLASLASVRACADALIAEGEKFDIIIANAGVMAPPFGRTADGFETQFGTNHLGHFLLVNRLAPLLREGGRLVNLSSAGHRYSDVDLEDPNFEHTPYDPWIGYGRSKTANILFAVEFDRRHRARGTRAAAVHPGGIRTELGRHMSDDELQALIVSLDESNKAAGLAGFEWKTAPQGAATSVWAAIVAPPGAVGGQYCEDCHVAELQTQPGIRDGVQPYALDPERAKALWALSERMVGETFA